MSPRTAASASWPGSVGSAVPVTTHDRDEQDRRHELHAGRDPEAPDHPARQRGDDVERAPREGGTETGQESEGHRRSLAGRRPDGGGILSLGTAEAASRPRPPAPSVAVDSGSAEGACYTPSPVRRLAPTSSVGM